MTLTYRSTISRRLTVSEGDGNISHLANSSGVTFAQSGSATSESLQSRGRWFAFVTDYLSDANRAAIRAGTSVDIATALTTALSEAYVVLVPPYQSYTLGSKVTVPTGKGIFGFNKLQTIITKAFNGDMFDLSATGSFLEGVYLAGAGATFTGKGVLVSTASQGKQRVHKSRISDMDGECIEFGHTDAGSGFSGFDLELDRTSAGTGTGRYAVTIPTTAAAGAVPRKFTLVETGGTCSFDFGGCNNVTISDSSIGDINFHANSRAVKITGTRLLNQVALTVDGFNHSIVGGDLSPNITIASGAGDNVIGPCSFNGSITDSSGLNTNQVFHKTQNYTPTFSAAGGTPDIGNGTIAGQFSREGTRVTFDIQFTDGSTTDYGTGQVRFGLPIARVNSTVLESCNVLINIGGVLYMAFGQFAGGVAYVAPIRDTSGSMTATSPAAFGTGDTVRISGSYYL